MDIISETKRIYKKYGQSKSMLDEQSPCFFLQRNYKGVQDLLIIFQTPPCHFNCSYCNLTQRNDGTDYPFTIIEQFYYVVQSMKHSLSVLNRITLSNNGSMLDEASVKLNELCKIIEAITQIKNIKSIAIETNSCYLQQERLFELKKSAHNARLNFIIGYETSNNKILSNVLNKRREPKEFLKSLDLLAKHDCDLTCYILYKPCQDMSDSEAYDDAYASAMYIINECASRSINLTLRINPMFAASGTEWARIASESKHYTPPRISQVYELARHLNSIVPTYIGLSTEGKSESWGTYRNNDDFSKELLLQIISFNSKA